MLLRNLRSQHWLDTVQYQLSMVLPTYTQSCILWFTHVFIKVCNTAHNFDCRRKKPPKFVPLKLEICLNYAYSLDLCCYNIVWTLTCFNGVCMCGCAKQRSWNFWVKSNLVLVTSTCENRPYSYDVVMNVSFCACAAQVSSYTTVLDRYKIVQSSLLTFTKHVGMVKDT